MKGFAMGLSCRIFSRAIMEQETEIQLKVAYIQWEIYRLIKPSSNEGQHRGWSQIPGVKDKPVGSSAASLPPLHLPAALAVSSSHQLPSHHRQRQWGC